MDGKLHCEQEVKDFFQAEGCFLDDSILPLEPQHDCCSQLRRGRGCCAPTLPFEEAKEQAVEDTKAQCRHLLGKTVGKRNNLKHERLTDEKYIQR